MTRGKGWVPDICRAGRGTLGAPSPSAELPQSVVVHSRAVEDIITDQVHTNSCVGQWIRLQVYAYLAVRGLPATPASASAAYVEARLWSGRRVIVDAGCFPRDMVDATSMWGVVPESVWPFDPSRINESLDLGVVEMAATHTIEKWRRVQSYGQARVQEIMALLAFGGDDGKGVAVGFGLDVDRAYDRYSGGVYERQDSEDSVGRHMQTITGYSIEPNGSVVFEVANSWGKKWGEGGFARIGAKTIASDYVDDIYAATAVPVLR